LPTPQRGSKKKRQQLISADGSAAQTAGQRHLDRINEALIRAERAFIDQGGLRGRSWYKHQIYAPGVYTGYAAQPLTDFRQGLDERNTTETKAGFEKVIEAIRRATAVLKQGAE